jgi:glycosyltransferase involved in cell wall biosynthesis
MKVLHLVGAQDDSGGILDVIRSLQTATAAQNCTHTVWVNHAFRETRAPSLSCRYSRHLLAESPSHLKLLACAMRAIPELRALLRREPFEVLHGHSRGALPLALLWATLGRRALVFTNHTYARRRGLYRWAARRPRLHTVLLTPNMGRYYGLAVEAPNIHVISPCVADGFFACPLVERDRSASPARPLRLVGIGNLVRWKNWHLVLAAFGLLSAEERSRVIFRHWGPPASSPDSLAYLEHLRATVQAHGLQDQCRFEGFAPSIEVVLREAGWLVLPSTNEPCSGAIIQALAMGVPVLAAASGGNVDLIRDRATGLLFAPDDPAALAAGIREILEGRVAVQAPEALRQSVQQSSAAAVAAQYLDLYRRVQLGTG